MKRRENASKTVAVAIILLLTTVNLASAFAPIAPNSTASTTPWLLGWNYRKSHTINSAPDAGNNYQVEITVHRANGADYGKNVYLNYRSLNWPNDIRFTGKDGITELNYWLEDSSTYTATFWVNVKDNLSYSGTTIYIYYGKSGASSTSNGKSTFDFFDDFSGSRLDTNKWIQTRGSSSILNSILTLSDGARIDSKINFGLHYAVYFRSQYANWDFSEGQISTGFRAELGDNDSNSVYIYAFSEPNFFTFVTRKNGQPSWNTMNESEDFNWHTFRYFRASSTSAKAQLDDGRIYEVTENVPTIHLPVTIETRAGYTGTVNTDWVFVRKYVPREPSQGNWSGEQQTSSQTVTEQVIISPSDWSYRKSHAVNAAAGAETNYPIKIVVHKGSGTDAGSDVYLNNHALNWPNDIRFAGSDMVTQLDYWMESADSSTATFWVRLKDNLSVAGTTIYLYYGSNSATTASNLTNTFIDADDFEGDTTGRAPSGWVTGDVAITVQSDSSYAQHGSKGLEVVNNVHANPSYRNITTINSDNSRAIEFWGKVITEDYNYYQYYDVMDNSGNVLILLSFRNLDSSIEYYDGSGNGNGWVMLQPYTVGTWYHFTIYNIDFTNQQFDVDIDGVNRLVGGHFFRNGISLSRFGIGSGGNFMQKDAFDTFFTRKYVSPEPSQGSWGREEATSEAANQPSGPFAEWGFKKSHVINPAINAGNNYQVKIIVHKGSGNDSGENVYLNNHALNWPNDIRFTGSDDNTELNYWLQSYDDSTAVFWVKLSYDLSTSGTVTYLYYGKSGAVSASNGDATFIFFDDFSKDTLNHAKWQTYAAGNGGSLHVSNGILQMRSNGGDSDWIAIRTISTFAAPYAWEARLNFTDYTTQMAGLYRESDRNPSEYGVAKFATPYGNKVSQETDYVNYLQRQQTFSFNQFNNFEIRRDASGYNDFYINDSLVQNDHLYTYSGPTRLMLGSYSLAAQTFEADWIFIRKYVSPEPSQGSWGTEQPANAQSTQPTQSGFPDWGYRKSHTINAAAGAGSNYPIKIVVHKGSGTDSAENVYLDNNAKNWPNDIRFTGKDGTTSLDYWMESYADYTATFWVKVNDDLSNTGTNIYIYYGKSGASSTSNGKNTFSFFDDFSGSNLDSSKWSSSRNGISVSDGQLHLTSDGNPPLSVVISDGAHGYSFNPTDTPVSIESRVYINSMGTYNTADCAGASTALTSPEFYLTWNLMAVGGSNYQFYVATRGGGYDMHSTYTTWDTGIWYRCRTTLTSSLLAVYQDSNTDSYLGRINRQLYVHLGAYALEANGPERTYNVDYDWVFARKYVSPEPSQGSWGGEEPANLAPPPIQSTTSWLSGWNYRKSHVINSAPNAGSNYQVRITAHRGYGTDSGENIYLNSKALSWPNDIRFTGSDGVTGLSYWMESSSIDAATFWVRVKDNLSAAGTTIYVYYGQSNASSGSDGDSTFLLYDGFNGNSLDTTNKWNVIKSLDGSVPTVDTGVLIFDASNESVYSKSNYGVNTDLMYRGNHADAECSRVGYINTEGSMPFAIFQRCFGGWWARSYISGEERTDLNPSLLGSYHKYEIRRDGGVANLYYVDDQLKATHISQVTADPLPVIMYDGPEAPLFIDWIAVRSYTNPEPSHGSWGIEEVSSGRSSPIPPTSGITTVVVTTRTVRQTTITTSTQTTTTIITQSTTLTNALAAKPAEQIIEPLANIWAIGATITALALVELLLLRRTKTS
ncbi:MAG: DUF2341 domain-containing protein [Thaumarchaeota archaeon]|nr:DUF2341 domain-containing protein [Nitrososphaerota archaeon]MCL5317060.1 DUF2341 domain-containing protein [Nitrososphaerota archaeon]